MMPVPMTTEIRMTMPVARKWKSVDAECHYLKIVGILARLTVPREAEICERIEETSHRPARAEGMSHSRYGHTNR